MTRYVGLLPRDITFEAQELVVEELIKADIKVERYTLGPSATLIFETDKPIPTDIRAKFEAISEDVPMKAFGCEICLSKAEFAIQMQQSLSRIGFDKIWAEPDFQGAPDIVIGINDTGIDDHYSEYYFEKRILEHYTAPGISGPNHAHARIVLAVPARKYQEYEEPEPDNGGDDNGPDKQKLKIAVKKFFRGACYAAKCLDARSLGPRGEGSVGTVAEGFNWLHSKGPDAVNASLGGPHSDVLDAIIKRMADDGIVVCVATGNNGAFPPPCDGRMNCPADAAEAIACGATDGGHEQPGNPEKVMTWTARNPTAKDHTNYHKQYCVGPGYGIVVGLGEPAASGTSLSAPHITAIFAAVLHRLKIKYPLLTKAERRKRAIEIVFSTAKNLGYKGSPNYPHDPSKPEWEQQYYCIQGWGRIDAYEAYKKAGEGPSEPRKIEKVEFILDSAKIGDRTEPKEDDIYELEHTVTKGIHVFKAVAYAKDLPSKESDPVTFEVIEEESKIICQVVAPKEDEKLKAGVIPFQVEAKLVA